MDLVEVVPGLHLVRFTHTNTHLLNAYLWCDDDGVTMIDTGAAGSGPVLRAALEQLGRQPQDVTWVVLTHFHEEHTGSAAEVADWGGAPVIAGSADAAVIRGDVPGPEPVFTRAEQALFAQVSAGLPAAPPCRVDQELHDGDWLDFAGGAQVLSVPGHTAGSVALHLPRHGVLLTGDTIAEGDGQALLGPFNVDRERAWESLHRQAALDVEIACVGHGNPIRDARRALRAAIDPFA